MKLLSSQKRSLSNNIWSQKFHEYCFGHFFTIQTDHKPLLGLITEKKGIPVNSAASIRDGHYFYQITSKKKTLLE